VLVVGAGPAGADLACGLARAGASVALVERLQRPEQAAFSSAALPLHALQQFGLPAQVVASRWSGWQLIGPHNQRRQWQQSAVLGAVLDFAALRRWQLHQAQAWGAEVQLGCTALGSDADDGAMVTRLRHADGRHETCVSRWVVDATGQARALLGDPDPRLHPLVAGVGLEWLLAVEHQIWQQWSNRLSFMLGSQWVPQGYGWVFPMQAGQLKVGVCRLIDPHQTQPALGRTLEQLLSRCDLGSATVLDRHGGLIRSTLRRGEAHARGRLIGLGDVVSTANLLGGEGIRHALTSSRTVLPLLLTAIGLQRQGAPETTQLKAVAPYSQRLRRRLGWRWELSGRLARRTWLPLQGSRADRRLERLLRGLEGAGADDLSALLFDYRFERYGWRALPYLLGLR
jgi:flavin-dependent dehydrogenase